VTRDRPSIAVRILAVVASLAVVAGCDVLGRPAGATATAPGPTAVATATAESTAEVTLAPAASDVVVEATPTIAPCKEKRGRTVDVSYRSKAAGTTVRYRVYLPPCYESSGRRYPYVILLHGSDRDQTEWTNLMHADRELEKGIANGSLPPMILVMPGGGDLANTRIFTAGKSFESVVLDEIRPAVEKRFCTLGTRAGRAIGGISRGGFWAFLIALRHPGMFSAVAGHSPFFHPDNAPPAYNPLDLVKTVKFVEGREPRIWVDAGADDYAMPGITPFVDSLEDRGFGAEIQMYPEGEHEISYWRSHVAEYLGFYGETWPGLVAQLPACKP
jgi:enterochelin esterase-like enzyme